MTIEEFRKIKKMLADVLNKWEIYVENKVKNNDKNITDEDESFQQNIFEEYLKLQDNLLNSDLSAIPFEEWEDITLISLKDLDLSKTHANIDFSLLKEIEYESINLNGCIVRGLERIEYDETTFDEEFKKNNPNYFPDISLPEKIRHKFYDKMLDFKDLIDYPLLRKYVNKYSFNNSNNSNSRILIEKIGYHNAIKLFDEYSELIGIITNNETYFFNFIITKNLSNDTYENAKEYVFNLVIDYLKEYNNEQVKASIPKDMKEKHPEAFLDASELNDEHAEDIAKLFNEGNLHFSAIRIHRKILQHKIIEIGTSKIRGINNINKIYGNVWNFLDSVPKELDYIVAEYLGSIYSDEKLENIKTLTKDAIIKNAIIKELSDAYTDYRLDMIKIYSKYLSIEDIIYDQFLVKFINDFGLDRLIKFNEQHNYILSGNSKYNTDLNNMLITHMARYTEHYANVEITDDNIYSILKTIIKKMKSQDDYKIKTIMKDCNEILSKEFSDIFIDYKLLNNILKNDSEEKEKQIILNIEKNIGFMLNELRKRPEILPVFLGKDLQSDIRPMEILDFYNEIGNDLFFKIGAKYGEGLAHLIIELPSPQLTELINELKQNNEFEPIINEYMYKIINNNRTFDIRLLADSFKKEHPELYLKENAPEALKSKFYGSNTLIIGGFNLLEFSDLSSNPEWIPHLTHIDLDKCLKEKLIHVYDSKTDNIGNRVPIFKALMMKFTKEEALDLFSKYGRQLGSSNRISVTLSMTKEELYESILNTIYNEIVKRNVVFTEEMPEEFKNKYPDLFIDKNIDERLRKMFYARSIEEETLHEHPEWIPFLKDKNLEAICNINVIIIVKNMTKAGINNETILRIFSKYGRHLAHHNVNLDYIDNLSINSNGIDANGKNTLEYLIKEEIIKSIIKKEKPYAEDLKYLIKDEHPELFLSDDAPENLKRHFYSDGFNYPLTFEVLKENKEWLPFLKNKEVLLSLKKQGVGKKGLEDMFSYYCNDDALKIGIKNPESVMKMLEANKFEVLKNWYEKFHFIPHHVVMLEFPFEESDKFLSSGKKWSQLMKIEKYNLNEESKSALLKASMCFGVFDGDSKGYNQVIELFTGIPKILSEAKMSALIHSLSRGEGLSQLYKEEDKTLKYTNTLEIIKDSYVKKDDGSYALNPEIINDKEKVSIIRNAMEISITTILTPDKAHQLFGGFIMEYDPDFREFLLQNMERILKSDEYISYVSAMQKQWHAIRILNSNRKLTLDLALAFVKSNTYENVEIGNEHLAEVSNQAGYSQQDFNTLQLIYNYGKSRVFSSIPRIELKQEEFSYEILRLDDPLALAIGTLTDCCQELGNDAEMSVEHSMVSSHGRVFVIRDNEGNIAAQSWVWRNKNILCFDNIEIPRKAFNRAEKNGMSREKFAETIYRLYEQAGKELIEKDEIFYKQLLEQEKITKEQYDSLKLAKVTVGIGYNDIREAIIKNSKRDEEKAMMPIEFTPKVELDHGLYTKDSRTQYLIAGEEKISIADMDTPNVYQDEFKILNDFNATELDLLMLQKLEYITCPNNYYLKTQVDNKESMFSQIAYNYNFNPETTRIIINSNFAIIYDNKENEIEIGDIFYNTTDIVTENIVIIQIRMALEQIKEESKTFNVSNLNEKQSLIFEKALSLDKEIDEERGIIHDRK